MGERKISISLDKELYARAKELADAEGVSVSAWLSCLAVDSAENAAIKHAWSEHFVRYGEPSEDVKRQAYDELKTAGFFDPPSAEREAARLAALARLHQSPVPDHHDEMPGADRPDDAPGEGGLVERKAG